MRGNENPKTILVLGANGMLGNAIFQFFSDSEGYQVFGSLRSKSHLHFFSKERRSKLIAGIDMENVDRLATLFAVVRPQIVINCVGLVKQLAEANSPLSSILINSLLPHRLAQLCLMSGARLIHISTDCVFSGDKGMYSESDEADATDLYGKSKYLGEVDYPHAITLRTSIIGHELDSARSLLEWFLLQEGSVRGYSGAIFSGLPTIELARVIRDYVLQHPELHGLYHVSSEPISKLDLLKLIANTYKKSIDIIPDDDVQIDRSLDSRRFKLASGYESPNWPELANLIYLDSKA